MSTAPFVRSSETSKAAAESILPHLSMMRARVLSAVIAHHPHGATCDDIERYACMRHQSVSPRLLELAELGIVRETGVKRQTRSGRDAFVWHLTGFAPRPADCHITKPKSDRRLQRCAAEMARLLEECDDFLRGGDLMWSLQKRIDVLLRKAGVR